MKKITYILMILILVTFVFVGCDTVPASNSVAATEVSQATDAPISDNAQLINEQITIISPVFYSGTVDNTLADESTLYLEELFKDNGFDVKFDRVFYNRDSSTCYEEYFSYLSQNLAKDNTLAFVPGYKIDLLSDYVNLQNLSKQIEDNAPNYFNYTERNFLISNSNDDVIISSISDFDNISVALISNNIRSSYDKSIEKSQEYLSFVTWTQKQNESMRPSVILTFHDDITTTSNILYDIFLPQLGYIPLGNYLGETYSLCVEAKKPEKVYDTTKFSFFDDMLETIELTANYSQIVVKHENNNKKNFSEYSSVVMPLGDISYYGNISDYNFYPPNYTMEILNPSMFLERKHENTYLAASEDTNQSEALQLLDWIYSDINNYIVVKYGEAGINYSFNENNYIFLTDTGKQYTSTSPISSMINNLEFEATLNSLPSNYLSEVNSIEYVKGDSFARHYENYQTLITTNNNTFKSVNRFTKRWETSVRALELTTERKVNFDAGKFKFEEIEDLIFEIVK